MNRQPSRHEALAVLRGELAAYPKYSAEARALQRVVDILINQATPSAPSPSADPSFGQLGDSFIRGLLG